MGGVCSSMGVEGVGEREFQETLSTSRNTNALGLGMDAPLWAIRP